MADKKNAYALPYTGKDILEEASTEYKDLPQPVRIVLHLIELYLNKGHHMLTNRHHTKIILLQALTDHSTKPKRRTASS